MKNVKRSWIALLLGGLLLATMVGAVWARPKGGPAAHDAAHKLDRPKAHHAGFHYTLTIPAADFNPRRDDYNWISDGNFVSSDSGSGYLQSVVPMLPGNRTVERLTLIAKDNNASNNICVDLMRGKDDGTTTSMAQVCSSGSLSNIRTFSTTVISPNRVWGGHGPYLWVKFPSSSSLDLYRVKIQYY